MKISNNIIKWRVVTLIPTIQTRWRLDNKTIFIQQDNPTPHINVNDIDFIQVPNNDGFEFEIVCQPTNNPSYFWRNSGNSTLTSTKNTTELVKVVEFHMRCLSKEKINYVFLSLQYVMNAIIGDQGGNNYNLLHHDKEK